MRAQKWNRPPRRAFTLIELLVVVSIIGLLISILVPHLSGARQQTRAAVCLARLRTLGQGLTLYTNEYSDVLVPGRMPRVDDENIRVDIKGGLKYRPTFLAMMGSQVGVPAFDDPQSSRTSIDRYGEAGDSQNYSSEVYLCPEVSEWTDERNGAFGYNYQFLGNSRLYDATDVSSYKNWPVPFTRVKSPEGCVAVADAMGTAASFQPADRQPYVNNGREENHFGNEGFNLDPPIVDPVNGEMAGLEEGHRTAVHERHRKRANVLWVDCHGSSETLKTLGYDVDENGVVTFGRPDLSSNRLWNVNQSNEPWRQE